MKSKTIDIPIYYGKLTIILVSRWEKVNMLYNTKINHRLYDAVVFEVKNKDHKNSIRQVIFK